MARVGWISVHRKLLDKGYYNKSQYVHLWLHVLLEANAFDKKMMWNGQEITVKEGSFITGRKQLAQQTGIKETTIERILKVLENGQQIEQQKTTKYRIITVCNWHEYQDKTLKRTTNGQQTDTINKDNKEIRNTEAIASPLKNNSKSMKKNTMGSYREDGFNDYEEVIDADSGELEEEPQKPVKKSFALQDKITQYKNSPQLHQRILWWYYAKKNLWVTVTSEGNLAGLNVRYAPMSKKMVTYDRTPEELVKAYERMEKENPAIMKSNEWTLETLEKYATK